MKPIKTVIIAAALSLAASGAMAQSATQEKTQSDMNPAVGDGSSGGKNPGAKDKMPGNASGASSINSGASMNTGTTTGAAPAQREGQTGDAVTTTGPAQENQRKN